MFPSIELGWVQYIQLFRTPFLDTFFKALNFFDTGIFYFILIPLVYLSLGWRTGLKIFYILILTTLSNSYIKAIFCLPRPLTLDPSLAVMNIKGFTFPSGAAQCASLLFFILIAYWKSPLRWPVAFTYLFLISFSRVYLGAHFPSDLLGGWVFGFALFGIYRYVFPAIEKGLSKLSPLSLFLIGQGVPLSLLFALHSPLATKYFAIAMGINLGLSINYLFNLSFPPLRSKVEFLIRAFVGVTGTLTVLRLIELSPSLPTLKLMGCGFWLSFLAPLLCKALFFKKEATDA